jgi:hypothetical protein
MDVINNLALAENLIPTKNKLSISEEAHRIKIEVKPIKMTVMALSHDIRIIKLNHRVEMEIDNLIETKVPIPNTITAKEDANKIINKIQAFNALMISLTLNKPLLDKVRGEFILRMRVMNKTVAAQDEEIKIDDNEVNMLLMVEAQIKMNTISKMIKEDMHNRNQDPIQVDKDKILVQTPLDKETKEIIPNNHNKSIKRIEVVDTINNKINKDTKTIIKVLLPNQHLISNEGHATTNNRCHSTNKIKMDMVMTHLGAQMMKLIKMAPKVVMASHINNNIQVNIRDKLIGNKEEVEEYINKEEPKVLDIKDIRMAMAQCTLGININLSALYFNMMDHRLEELGIPVATELV